MFAIEFEKKMKGNSKNIINIYLNLKLNKFLFTDYNII